MKSTNKAAKKVLDTLTAGLEIGTSKKIDNASGAFMAVSVEKIGETENFEAFSVAHYYEQNGDLCSDPRMEFLKAKINGEYYAYYFRQDGLFGRDEESVILNGANAEIRPRMQADHAKFAGLWMRNIKQQQRI